MQRQARPKIIPPFLRKQRDLHLNYFIPVPSCATRSGHLPPVSFAPNIKTDQTYENQVFSTTRYNFYCAFYFFVRHKPAGRLYNNRSKK